MRITSAAKSEASSPPVPGAHFHENVLLVVRILRLEQDLELGFESRLLRLQVGQLHFGELAHLVVGFDHLARVRQTLADVAELAVLRHQILDLGDRLHGVAVRGHVGHDRRVGDLPLQLFVPLFDVVEFLVHGFTTASGAKGPSLHSG
jgi:hypothetical protein